MRKHNFYYEICLYITILLNWGCFYKILSALIWSLDSLTTLEIIGHIALYGNLAAMGIIISHEIYHKESSFNKTIGLVNMINTFYIHWTVEHVIGHHRNVATPKDAATAPKDMSFYEFYPRAVIGTWKSCYQI